MYENVRDFLSSIAPDQVGIVQLHKSRKPIFDQYGVSRQIKASFGKTSTLPSGAYIVIESTEAMHVIDVNSGPKMQRRDQESSALAVNLEAAEEIARQLRLRDIGGLIIIDFIDMRSQENKIKLLQEMRQFMKRDRAQHTILPLSKFGLMQITRQRVKPEVVINTEEQCPTCEGTGKITPTILIGDALKRDLEFILNSRPKARVRLETHPYIHAWLKHGLPSQQMRWWWEYNMWIPLRANNDFGLNEYKFFDKNNDEIRM
jgi:ribonuclease G